MARGYSPLVEQKIIKQLNMGRKHRKVIAKCANIPVGTVGAALASMAKEGRVTRIAPGTYILAKSKQKRLPAHQTRKHGDNQINRTPSKALARKQRPTGTKVRNSRGDTSKVPQDVVSTTAAQASTLAAGPQPSTARVFGVTPGPARFAGELSASKKGGSADLSIIGRVFVVLVFAAIIGAALWYVASIK